MGSRAKSLIMLLVALLTAQLTAGEGTAKENDPSSRLLRAAEGLQMPGSEADSFWWFVAYPGEELSTAERMASLDREHAALRAACQQRFGSASLSANRLGVGRLAR